MVCGGKSVHVRTDFRDNDLGGSPTYAWNTPVPQHLLLGKFSRMHFIRTFLDYSVLNISMNASTAAGSKCVPDSS